MKPKKCVAMILAGVVIGSYDIKKLFKDCPDNEKVLLDVKGLYEVKELKNSGMSYWRL